MRDIAFRGKRVDNGKWTEGYYVCLNEKVHFIYSGYAETNCGNYYADRDEVIPETVGQYAGLTDKNGTKIFEGDIVRIAYWFGWDDEQQKNVPEEEYISKVYSIDGCPFCVDLIHDDGDMTPLAWIGWVYDDVEVEVIGNIHDNPELLKGGADNA